MLRVNSICILAMCFLYIFILACDSPNSKEKFPLNKIKIVKTSSITNNDDNNDVDNNKSNNMFSMEFLTTPNLYTHDSTITFSFMVKTDQSIYFICTINNNSEPCESPYIIYIPKEGKYNFRVESYIINTKSYISSLDYHFVIDRTPPAISKVQGNEFYKIDDKPIQPIITWNEDIKEMLCAFQSERDPIDTLSFSLCDTIFRDLPQETGAYLLHVKAKDLADNMSNSVIADGYVIDNTFQENNIAVINIHTLTSTSHDGFTFSAVKIFREFYNVYHDDYDMLCMFTTFEVTQQYGFASSLPLKTNIEGIGYENYPDTQLIKKLGGSISKTYGSKGRLEHILRMNTISRYPDNPWSNFVAPNGYIFTSPLWILAHELAHRWGMYIYYPDKSNVPSDILLDGTKTHYQFFMNSGGSPLEGNIIIEYTPSHFTTLDIKYPGFFGSLELYLMGFISPDQVENTFAVLNPDISADIHAKGNLQFTGERYDVNIDTIIQINGKRSPSHALSPKGFRIAFILFETNDYPADYQMKQKVDRYRKAFQSYWFFVTKGYSTLDTNL